MAIHSSRCSGLRLSTRFWNPQEHNEAVFEDKVWLTVGVPVLPKGVGWGFSTPNREIHFFKGHGIVMLPKTNIDIKLKEHIV